MVALYAVAVVAGAVGVCAWVVTAVLSERPGSHVIQPDTRFGVGGRMVVAAVLGFGLGGMSAAYGGWHAALAFGAAVAGAALMAVSTRLLGVGGDGA